MLEYWQRIPHRVSSLRFEYIIVRTVSPWFTMFVYIFFFNVLCYIHILWFVFDSQAVRFMEPDYVFSFAQEEARVGHSEHSRTDSSEGASGDPQHRQGHREQRWRQQPSADVTWPRPFLRGAGHLRGPLPEPGHESHRPHGVILLLLAATTPPKNQNTCPGKPRRGSLKNLISGFWSRRLWS